jgi:hypothetical protein
VLGNNVVTAIFFAGVVDRHDIRMLQHANHVRFIKEHLAGDLRALGVRVFFNVVNFDRDVATVIRIVRQEDGTGAALAYLVDDDVLTDLVGHVCRALDFRNTAGHVVSSLSH